MIPDLGKYADTVLWAYATSLVLLVLLVLLTLLRGRRIRDELQHVEDRASRDG